MPVVTALDSAGAFHEADQRALVRFVLQEGYGADVVFAAGTTGEWDRVAASVCRRVIQTSVEEVAKFNAQLDPRARPVEAWAGVTAKSARDTLENLEFAIAQGADAAVLAPLSIEGIDDPVRFVTRDVADLLDGRTRRIPIFLYDNADIAIDPNVPHIRTKQVKALSRLDFVRGIKVSASRKVLGNYTKAASNFHERGEFGIYIGNAMLIFDWFRPQAGVWGALREHWNRYRMRGGIPIGVVAGPANAMPREWARAWQVCRAGDVERMDAAQTIVSAFRDASRVAGGKRTIACLKRALACQGVTEFASVAAGTPALTAEEAEQFDRDFEAVRALAHEQIGAPWVSVS